jgi:hypothetical protein
MDNAEDSIDEMDAQFGAPSPEIRKPGLRLSQYSSTEKIHQRVEAKRTLKVFVDLRQDFSEKSKKLEQLTASLHTDKNVVINLETDERRVEASLSKAEAEHKKAGGGVGKGGHMKELESELKLLRFKKSQTKQRLEQNKLEFSVTDKSRDNLMQEITRLGVVEAKYKSQQEEDSKRVKAVAAYNLKNMQQQIQHLEQEHAAAKKRSMDETLEAEEAMRKEAARVKGMQDALRAKLNESVKKSRAQLTDVHAKVEELRVHRVENILKLRRDLDAASRDIIAKNELKQNRERKIEAERLKERYTVCVLDLHVLFYIFFLRDRLELAAAGRNPSAVFAVRDEVDKQQKIVEAAKAKSMANSLGILNEVISQDEREKKQRIKAIKIEKRAQAYRNIMGRSLIQQQITKMTREEEQRKQEELQDQLRKLSLEEAGSDADRSDKSDDDIAPSTRSPTRATSGGESAFRKTQPIKEKIPLMKTEFRLQYMQKKIAKAREAAETKLAEGTPMKVCGKEYKTIKFLAAPAEIIFEDFTVGETMCQRIVLTNTSFAFNSFKVLALPDEYSSFFLVTYKKVGRMSAGNTATIQIEFMPKVNEDIFTELPLLAETGPFSVPLKCLTKKAVITVGPRVVDIGVCIMGEEKSAVFEVKNDGALAVDFRIQALSNAARTNTAISALSSASHPNLHSIIGTEELSASVLDFPVSSRVEGYSTTKFNFVFRPTKGGSLHLPVKLAFGNPADRAFRWGSANEFEVVVKALASELPVIVENPIIDFQVCSMDRLYRAACTLQNRSAHAAKIQMQTPAALKGLISFTPAVGYVQAQSSFDVQVNLLIK